MLSSTSSSESLLSRSQLTTKTLVVLLATILFTLIAFEAVTRIVIERKSKVQRMVNEEYLAAIHLGSDSGNARKNLLIVGNSLVGHGIDLPELQEHLPPNWDAHRYWIYNTSYTDWYFGLKRLFLEGSRPDVVAVVFAAMHWEAEGTRGDYAAQYLFETRDIPAIKERLDLDKTATISLLLSRYSKFYAMRSEIRKVLLNQILPDLPQMFSLLQPGPTLHMADSELIKVATTRIKAYKDLVCSYNAQLVLIVPPVPRPREEHQEALRVAAARTGVTILMPLTASDLRASDFADDVHLTPAGAKIFTSKLTTELVPALEKLTSSRR